MRNPPEAIWAVYPTETEPFELVRFDVRTGARVARVELSGAIPDDAKHLAIGFGAAWVASGHRIVHRVELATARVVATLELWHHLEAIAVTADAVWVSSGLDGGRLFRIDPRTNAVDAVPSPGYPRKLAAVDDGLWISHGAHVTRLDTRTMRPTEMHELGGFVDALCEGECGVAWAAARDAPDSGALFRLDAERAVRVAPIDGSTSGLACGAGTVWTAADRLLRLDVATGAVEEFLDEHLAAPCVVGDRLWAVRTSCPRADSALVHLDLASRAVTVVASGGSPAALAAG